MRSRKKYILLVTIILAASCLFFTTHSTNQVVSYGAHVKKETSGAAPAPNQSSGPPVKVIVFAYWRTGSSIIGELFNQNSDAFYLYEPLNGFFYPVNRSLNAVRREASGKIVPSRKAVFRYDTVKHSAEELSRFMEHILQCELEKIPDSVFAYRFMKQSRALYEFNFCMDTDLSRAPNCRHLLLPLCRSARLRALKDVWVSMPSVEKLLQRDSSLKIIHLLRDPRAVVLSRQKAFWKGRLSQTKLQGKVQTICKNMTNDFRARQKMQENFPANFLEVIYEDFAEQPITVAKDIYKFVRQSLPSEVEKWLRKSTNSQAGPKESSYQTVRKNSTATAYHWKEVADFKLIHKIDLLPECQEAYKLFGYQPVKNKHELRNRAIIHRNRHR